MKTIALELGQHGITANTIDSFAHPGGTERHPGPLDVRAEDAWPPSHRFPGSPAGTRWAAPDFETGRPRSLESDVAERDPPAPP